MLHKNFECPQTIRRRTTPPSTSRRQRHRMAMMLMMTIALDDCLVYTAADGQLRFAIKQKHNEIILREAL